MSKEFDNITIRLSYTQDQISDMTRDLAQAIADRESLENEKKNVMDQFKDQIGQKEISIKMLAGNLRLGTYFDSVRCDVYRDFDNREVYYIRCDTCEIAKIRPMRPEELQMTLEQIDEEAEAVTA